MEDLYNHINPDTNRHAPLISTELITLIREHKDKLNSVLIYDRFVASCSVNFLFLFSFSSRIWIP